jgi:hypothetical protein
LQLERRGVKTVIAKQARRNHEAFLPALIPQLVLASHLQTCHIDPSDRNQDTYVLLMRASPTDLHHTQRVTEIGETTDLMTEVHRAGMVTIPRSQLNTPLYTHGLMTDVRNASNQVGIEEIDLVVKNGMDRRGIRNQIDGINRYHGRMEPLVGSQRDLAELGPRLSHLAIDPSKKDISKNGHRKRLIWRLLGALNWQTQILQP